MSREANDVDHQGPADGIEAVLAGVQAADFERLVPPAELWGDIQATVGLSSSSSLKTPPHRNPKLSTVVEYQIDADDRVLEVGAQWAEFAQHNDAPELAEGPWGGLIWDYFGSKEIAELWQLLVQRVRATQRSATVPLRCDAAHTRRWFEMVVAPMAGHRVGFVCTLLFEQERPLVTLLDKAANRESGREPVKLCSWCGRGEHRSQWYPVEELIQAARLLENQSMPPVSYGVCQECRVEMAADLLLPAESQA